VRLALSYAYDFETANRTLFQGTYTALRAATFDNSELAARGLPSAEELRLLEPLRGPHPREVFTTEYNPPRTPGTGIEGWRENRRIATQLLRDAGLSRGQQPAGQRAEPAARLRDPAQQPAVRAHRAALRREPAALGINARVRTVDTAQYQRRMEQFDFDMTVEVYGQSESPGNEQRDYWSAARSQSRAARTRSASRTPALDQLVNAVIAAPDRAALVTRVRALDRVLQWGYYVVPNWHSTTTASPIGTASAARRRRHRASATARYLWWVDRSATPPAPAPRRG
jgi:microcin C transport system substrate-binding protein